MQYMLVVYSTTDGEIKRVTSRSGTVTEKIAQGIGTMNDTTLVFEAAKTGMEANDKVRMLGFLSEIESVDPDDTTVTLKTSGGQDEIKSPTVVTRAVAAVTYAAGEQTAFLDATKTLLDDQDLDVLSVETADPVVISSTQQKVDLSTSKIVNKTPADEFVYP